VLIGAASLEPEGNQGVAFVLDLTERRRAESEAREAQMELAHANRVATMGQLTASIAHEVNQPIAATKVNAQAALRWLNRDAPDLEEARQLLARIVKDGDRAGNVVSRIRDLVKKAPPRMEPLYMNEVIGEVIELTRSEAMKSDVSVQTQFAENLSAVTGDQTQLQQVILNLILNAVQAMSESGLDVRELQICTEANQPGGKWLNTMYLLSERDAPARRFVCCWRDGGSRFSASTARAFPAILFQLIFFGRERRRCSQNGGFWMNSRRHAARQSIA
jgi:signal transduction histidine kinase